jgi:hypothetical protein
MGRSRRRLLGGVGPAAGISTVLPVFRLPQPSGSYAIGTVTYRWVDRSRAEIFTHRSDDRRELVVQVWYPARPEGPVDRAPYVPDAGPLTSALGRVFGAPGIALRGIGLIETHAAEGAPVAGPGRFPVLLFLEGLGGFRQMNSFQVEELVSHGYVVVGLDQPYAAASVIFPDGRRVEMSSLDRMRPLVRQSYLPAASPPVLDGQDLPDGVVPYLAQDVSFVLDELETLDADPSGMLNGHLDLARVGAFGCSLGGIVAADAGRVDPRIKALLLMDAPVPVRTVEAGLGQPTTWITRPVGAMRDERDRSGGWSEEEIRAHHLSMRSTFDSLRAPGYFIQIPHTSHLDFTDVPLWSPAFARLGVTGPAKGELVHRIINDYSLAFFDRHLAGAPDGLLEDLAHRYPDVTIERHLPHDAQGGP